MVNVLEELVGWPLSVVSRAGFAGSEPSIEEIDMLLDGRWLADGAGKSRPLEKDVNEAREGAGWVGCCACGA